MILVATGQGSPTYLLYGGRRAVAWIWAQTWRGGVLRLQGRSRTVARSLLNAVSRSPRITAPPDSWRRAGLGQPARVSGRRWCASPREG